MRDPNNSFISSINPSYSLEALRAYVKDKNNSEYVLLFGLFDKSTHQHIGNIKFEPIVKETKYAVLGILIGEVSYRGIGIAKEAISNTFEKILMKLGIEKIILGVDKRNSVAISAYSKCGFKVTDNALLNLDKNSIEMVLYPNIMHMRR